MPGIIKNSTIFFIFIVLVPGLKSGLSQVKQQNIISKTGPQIKYSNLDSWYYWEVNESFIVGGATKKLYQIGKVPNPLGLNKLLEKDSESAWATTNLYAKMGVDVGIPCVFPEKKDNGYCCRLESKINEVNVIGMKLKVLVSGTLFLGEVMEPVRSVKDPIRKLNHGIIFSGKPKAIQFSYKYKSGQKRVKSVYGSTPVDGPDKGEFCMILQKRREDENGNVYATRIGGARNFFNDTANKWVNDTTITIRYGNITKEPFYNPKIMGLIPQISELYVKNSKNKMVPLTETGWDTGDETPTHLILYFTSSFEGINYTGSPESVFWIDNIRLIY
jgi:hypothetical protein